MDVRVMDVSQVINALGLAGALLIYLTPTILIAITVYLVKRQKKLRKSRKDESKEGRNKPSKERMEPEKPTSNTTSMALEFDKDGRIKK